MFIQMILCVVTSVLYISKSSYVLKGVEVHFKWKRLSCYNFKLFILTNLITNSKE